MDAPYEALLTPLKSYQMLLRKSVHPPTTETTDQGEILWLKTMPSHRVTRNLLNGLELLALLAHLDWEVWKQRVLKIWHNYKLGEFRDKPARVGVDLDPNMEGRVEPVLEVFATSAQAHAQSADIVRARQVALRMLHDRGEELTEVPVRVSRTSTTTLNSIIFKVMQAVVTQRFLASIDENKRAPAYQGLRIRLFRPLLESMALSATDLQQLAVIVEAGVEVDDFGAIKPEAHVHDPHIVAKSLWTLFAVGTNDESVSLHGVKRLAFNRSFRVGTVPCLYSAIHSSTSVECFTIDPSIDAKTPIKYCEQVWPWIAYAVFCQVPSNTHKLRELSLKVDSLREADVKLMRDVIEATDPVSKVFPRASSLAAEAISASRFHLTDPTKKTEADKFSVESSHVLSDLPVLKRSKEWTTVLLTACGHAWVHRDDVITKQRWGVGPFRMKKVARLEVTHVNGESKAAVMALLRLIGSGVKHLVLKEQREHVDVNRDAWLTEIFDVCPNLESLDIDRMSVSSLQFLLDAYESGKCRLTRFSATMMNFISVDESLRRIFIALADRAHPAARYMSAFTCSPVRITTMMDPATVAITMGMLEKNNRLRDFELGFLWSDPESRRLVECTEPFKVYDKQKISRAIATPLDTRRRVAFLSVVSQPPNGNRRGRRQPRAVEKLDACVLSLIFQMAATCCERRVRLELTRVW